MFAGVNDGKDFDEDFLLELYEDIRNNEISMSSLHHGRYGPGTSLSCHPWKALPYPDHQKVFFFFFFRCH